MTKDVTFGSALAGHLNDFLQEKHSLGFVYNSESYWLRDLDRYWSEHKYDSDTLTEECLRGWIRKRETEGKKCHSSRGTIARQFSLFLIAQGLDSYVPAISHKLERTVPHIFTVPEIQELFQHMDAYIPKNGKHSLLRLAHEYPVIMRVLICTGMRISEVCGMRISDADLDNGIISVYKAKGDRDRLVYLPDDLLPILEEYRRYMEEKEHIQSEWFFPGEDTEKHISGSSVRRQFNAALKESSFFESCEKKPRIHDLRHTYVVMRINAWAAQGVDTAQMAIYLSKQLGHSSVEETYYYYHYVRQVNEVIWQKDKISSKVIPDIIPR